eukprot:4869822-Pyramimonas_sp.AAC.1
MRVMCAGQGVAVGGVGARDGGAGAGNTGRAQEARAPAKRVCTAPAAGYGFSTSRIASAYG